MKVENVTSSSAVLKWTRPEEMNGVFQGYKVYFNDTYISTNFTNMTLSGLEGQTVYKLSVKASTIEDSDPSNVINIETLTGSEFFYKFALEHQLFL